MRIAIYAFIIFGLLGCSNRNFNQLTKLCVNQLNIEKLTYTAEHKLKSSYDEDITFTVANVYLKLLDDTIYPYEFLIIDSNQNFISFLDDTVYSYHSSFSSQYYDLSDENGLNMVNNGYKFNMLFPEVCLLAANNAGLKWKKKKQGQLIQFTGSNDDVSQEIEFSSGLLQQAKYSFYSSGYYYYDEHSFRNYRFRFDVDTLRQRKASLERYVPSEVTEAVEEKPKISFPSFTDLEGRSVDISTSKIVILDFFFNGCPPCVASIPKLNELHEKIGDNIPMYGINAIDKSVDQIAQFQKKYGVKYPLLMGDKSFNNELGIRSYPELLVIKDGELIYRHIGTLYTLDDILDFLEGVK